MDTGDSGCARGTEAAGGENGGNVGQRMDALEKAIQRVV